MRIEALQYFIEVAKSRSINAAAEKLYISQPALGIAIKNLEKELGFPLFERNHNGVKLTPWGEKTLEYAVKMVDEYNKLSLTKYLFEHRDIDNRIEDLTINTVKVFSAEIMPQILTIFSNAYNNVLLSVFECCSDEAIKNIQDGKCDLSIFNWDVGDIEYLDEILNEEYLKIPLWDEKLHIILSKKSDLAEKKMLSLSQLQDKLLTAVSFTENSFFQEEYMNRYLPNNKLIFRSNNCDLIHQYIAETNAIGFTFIRSFKDMKKIYPPTVAVIPLKENIAVRFFAVYRIDNPRRKLIEVFINAYQDLYYFAEQ